MSDLAKRNAALKALDFVEDGMVLGLGTGSTAAHLIEGLGRRVREGLRIRGVPTSEQTRILAEREGIPMLDPDQADAIDLDIDGADEIDPAFRIIKGGGGALLREKIIAAASARMIVIADRSKAVAALGAFPLPIEIVAFGRAMTAKRVAAALRESDCVDDVLTLRQRDGAPFLTDGGHLILDAHARRIPNPEVLADALARIPGVVEHGLFLGLADTLILGDGEGAEVRTL